MKPTHFQIEFRKKRILPSGGLTLVGHILDNSGFIDRMNRQALWTPNQKWRYPRLLYRLSVHG